MQVDFIKTCSAFQPGNSSSHSVCLKNWHKSEFQMNFSVGNKHIFPFKYPIYILGL